MPMKLPLLFRKENKKKIPFFYLWFSKSLTTCMSFTMERETNFVMAVTPFQSQKNDTSTYAFTMMQEDRKNLMLKH
jgi:hypothetical protein